jgi:hypothetical protein
MLLAAVLVTMALLGTGAAALTAPTMQVADGPPGENGG